MSLSDFLDEKLGIKQKEIRPKVREKFLPLEEIPNDPLPSRTRKKIKTDRDLDKEGLTSRIVKILTNKKDSIPIEVFRGFDLFFRTIEER